MNSRQRHRRSFSDRQFARQLDAVRQRYLRLARTAEILGAVSSAEQLCEGLETLLSKVSQDGMLSAPVSAQIVAWYRENVFGPPAGKKAAETAVAPLGDGVSRLQDGTYVFDGDQWDVEQVILVAKRALVIRRRASSEAPPPDEAPSAGHR